MLFFFQPCTLLQKERESVSWTLPQLNACLFSVVLCCISPFSILVNYFVCADCTNFSLSGRWVHSFQEKEQCCLSCLGPCCAGETGERDGTLLLYSVTKNTVMYGTHFRPEDCSWRYDRVQDGMSMPGLCETDSWCSSSVHSCLLLLPHRSNS